MSKPDLTSYVQIVLIAVGCYLLADTLAHGIGMGILATVLMPRRGWHRLIPDKEPDGAS